MAEASGRDLIIKRMIGSTYTTIASVTSKTVEKTNSGVDITTDDADGWQTFLPEPGTRAVNLSISGVTTDDLLLAAMSAATASITLEDCQILYPSGATDTGDFQFSSLSTSGEKDGATVFEASMTSSGTITYAAAP